MKYKHLYALFLTFIFNTSSEGQNKTDLSKENIKSETEGVTTSSAPNRITQNIIQDRKGNIWIASWEGIFRYDARLPDRQAKSFTNITSKVSSAHFFSVLEDRKGNFWFGSIGAGVYYYDGKSFQNFTTKDGLAGNGVDCIYEDKAGNVWFGTEEGASRYDGKSFRNYMIKGGVNSIIEDNTGEFWFATRDNTYIFDGKTFTGFTHNDKPFTNVRSIIKDKKGNIWLGGIDGLWRYDGKRFSNLTQNFVASIYEDKKGNIWTSSESANDQDLVLFRYDEKSLFRLTSAKGQWVLSRYDEKSLFNKKPTITDIKPDAGMISGILEANDGSIWFGTSDGVRRYNGNSITDFKSKEGEK